MYRIGETVLYGTEGVCTIIEVREMKISRETAQYYVLRPVYREGSTVFVPMNNQTLLAKMRPLLSVDEINAMLTDISSEGECWIEDASERKAEFQRILLGGDRQELLRMIRTLYLHRQRLQEKGKRLRTNDDQLLRDAEKLLNDEFALVLGIKQREVPEYIRSRVEAKTA